MKEVSVIVCTYNRCDSLKPTLRSLSKQSFPTEDYEIIVVDNNSTDNTKELVSSLMTSVPNLRYASERKQGANHARNRGIKEAGGNILAFTDDDVSADKDWIKELCAAFNEYPDASAVAGRAIPIFEGGRPSWLSDRLLPYYGDTQFGSKMRYLKFPEFPFGLNMAFRRKCLQKVGFFNPKLGRIDTRLLSHDEKETFYLMDRLQLKTLYTPHAVIRHMIPRARTRKRWLISRSYWQGASQVIFEQIHNPDHKLSLLKKAFRRLGALMKTVATGVLAPRSIDFVWLAGLVYQHGQASQYFRMAVRHQRV